VSRADLRRVPVFLAALAMLCATAPVVAQEQPVSGAAPRPASSGRDTRRLFQRFAEDAAIVPAGWVEGQFVYTNPAGDGTNEFLGGQFAFGVTDQVEAGLRLGWGHVDASDGPDGSGLSDIDIYGKYRFHGSASRCAVGALIKAATGDEDKGLGTGATDVEAFGACRADLQAVTVVGNAGLRYNGATDPPLPDAKNSMLLGGGLLMPVAPQVTLIIEATWESERLDGAGADARLTIGAQYGGPAPGLGFRGALAAPLSQGAPDFQVLFGAVYTY
jgi:hypothetical protein